MKIISYSLLIVLLVSASLYAAEKRRMTIAIMDFENKENVSREEVQKLSELLYTEMTNARFFNIVERSNISKMLKEKEYQQTGCTDQECAVELGKELNATHILVGSIMQQGYSKIINARLVDLRTSRSEVAQTVQYNTDQEMANAVLKLVCGLCYRINKETPRHCPEEYSNPYGWAAFPFALTSLGALGATLYYNHEYNDKQSKYNSLRSVYYFSGPLSVLVHMKMEKIKNKADKDKTNRLIFTIASGTLGAVAIPLGIVWIVKMAALGSYSSMDQNITENIAVVFPVSHDCIMPNARDKMTWGFGIMMKY